jgi:diacylglycerol O-acyltransferase
MRRLSVIDAGFLLTESPHSPKHVASLQILELPKGKGPAWLRKMLDELKRFPPGDPFNQRLLMDNPLAPRLIPDDRFDIDYHVRHSVLPHPGNERQLVEMVARLHANLLDRDRPLWEFHLIEGLSKRRFAFYTKVHHAIADGFTVTRWFTEIGSTSSRKADSIPVWANDEPPSAPADDGSLVELLVDGVRMLGGGLRTAAQLSALSARLVQKRWFERNRNAVLPLGAQRTSLNVATGAARSLDLCQFDLTEFKAVAHAHGGTVNDLVMTLSDVAVNRYLTEHGDAPDEPLVAYMPVNLRADEAGDGNLISLLQVKLANDHDDPVEAMRQIREASKSTREIYGTASRPAIQLYSLTVALMPLAEEMLGLEQILPPAINLVISNVPGPRRRMYFRGAAVLEAYPVTTLPPAVALNITVCSYAGRLFFGLIGGRSAVPDLHRLTEHLQATYGELKERAG